MRKTYGGFLFLFLYLLSSINFANSAPVLVDVDNNKIDFSSLHGKWVLINFWASWCEPCINEINEYNILSAKHKDTISIFAVNYDSLTQDEQKYVANKYAIKYPTLLQNSIIDLHLGDIPVIPITYIFNQQGKLVAKLYGGQTVASIEDKLKKLDKKSLLSNKNLL